ncbi:hypothetical protein A8C32_19365 [Flavivirga aquatica]|uniref:Right handed beta helix domain-containing protein n=1 Tax=Flavivirga aquatica TaxID=1849968 RepID=A0A1E5T3P2_9FLAO|nr:hypothetical protein [Flavivirga aquatica]OEK05992.1 hypothetical protein A8C32_19365 [Flavivirga aquatica]
MKKILTSVLLILFSFLIGNSQIDGHNSRVKIFTVNHLGAVSLADKMLVVDSIGNEVKHFTIQDLEKQPDDIYNTDALFTYNRSIDFLTCHLSLNRAPCFMCFTTDNNLFTDFRDKTFIIMDDLILTANDEASIETAGSKLHLGDDIPIKLLAPNINIEEDLIIEDNNVSNRVASKRQLDLVKPSLDTYKGKGITKTDSITGDNLEVVIGGISNSGGSERTTLSPSIPGIQIEGNAIFGYDSMQINNETDSGSTVIINDAVEDVEVILPLTSGRLALQSEIESGGGNPNIVAIMTEFQLYDVSNTNKTLSIQGDFSLTANRIIPPGVTLESGGGVINFAGFKLTGSKTKAIIDPHNILFNLANGGSVDGTWDFNSISANNVGANPDGILYASAGSISASTNLLTITGANFTSSDINDVLFIQGAGAGGETLVTTIASIVSPTTVTLVDNAVVTITNTDVGTGTDNYEAFLAQAYIRNSSDCPMSFNNGIYYTRAVAAEQKSANTPKGLVYGYGTDVVIEGNGAEIRSLPHNYEESYFMSFYEIKRLAVSNLLIIGETLYHDESVGGAHEGVHGFTFLDNVETATFINCESSYFQADGWYGKGDTQFTNIIAGTKAIAGNVDSRLSLGNIDGYGNIQVEETDYIYSTDMLDITTFQWDDNPFYHVTGSGFAGWSGLTFPTYEVIYYDSRGVFIEKSPIQTFYNKIPIRNPNWAQMRLVFKDVTDKELINVRIRPDLLGSHISLFNCNATFNKREGLSNGPSYFLWQGGLIADNGDKEPGFGTNHEDRRGLNMNVTYRDVIFRNNYGGDLSFVGTKNVTLDNIHLERSTRNNWSPQVYEIGISSTARNLKITNSTIEGKSVSLSRNAKVDNLFMNGGRITTEGNAVYIKNSHFHNVIMPTVENEYARMKDAFEHCKFTYDDPAMLLGATNIFRDDTNKLDLNDVEVIFNWQGRSTYLQEKVFTYELSDYYSTSFFAHTLNQTINYGGEIKNFKVYGAKPSLDSRDYSSENFYIPHTNYTNAYFGTSVEFQRGVPRSLTHSNFKVDGWLQFNLNQYENTVTGNEYTHKFNDGYVHINNDYNWTNSGSNLLDTEAKYFNLEFNDFDFDLQVSSSQIGSSNRYMRLKHFGTTRFNRCSFKSVSAKIIDFTNTLIFPATFGAVTIKNPKLDNVIFILRPEDKLLFTYPDANCPAYIDNSTAVEALGIGYYYKDSSNKNKFEITY